MRKFSKEGENVNARPGGRNDRTGGAIIRRNRLVGVW